MMALYGKHESMLNELKFRFQVRTTNENVKSDLLNFGLLHIYKFFHNNYLFSSDQNSYISDFYAYFREPWAAAIFHDKFECLRVENRATLLSQMVRDRLFDTFICIDIYFALIFSLHRIFTAIP